MKSFSAVVSVPPRQNNCHAVQVRLVINSTRAVEFAGAPALRKPRVACQRQFFHCLHHRLGFVLRHLHAIEYMFPSISALIFMLPKLGENARVGQKRESNVRCMSQSVFCTLSVLSRIFLPFSILDPARSQRENSSPGKVLRKVVFLCARIVNNYCNDPRQEAESSRYIP